MYHALNRVRESEGHADMSKITVIAEIGMNHNGNMDLAKCLIDEAKAIGADVAKFQFFDISEYMPTSFEWYDWAMNARLTYDDAAVLKDYCDRVGIEFLASVFNLEGVEWAKRLGMQRYKIPSRAIRQQDLIDALVDTGKEIIASLGMWGEDEFPVIESPVPVKFLYCVSKYPTLPADLEFEKIDFGRYAGFSDHTIGIDAAIVAISRGAKIIEKHFTLSKQMYGADHAGSAVPEELRQVVDFARRTEAIIS